MRKKNRREIDVFNLSFLDVVSCGFGAIILLLVIIKVAQPSAEQAPTIDLSGRVVELERSLPVTREELEAVTVEATESRDELDSLMEQVIKLRGEIAEMRASDAAAQRELDKQEEAAGELASAKQSLSEELKRLLGDAYRRPPSDATIGGVPVDSDHIIFIIDTSGSMQQEAWSLVIKKIREILEIYPRVKGIQVMNDMGQTMFHQYAQRWMPDDESWRRRILDRLRGWQPFSNSSPVEGIEAAIRRFYDPNKNISLYVFGDDFAHGSLQGVVDTVERLNRAGADGKRRVRIHAVGFPVHYYGGGAPGGVVRFAALMRKLAENNEGSFVGLHTTRR